jgi:hypothetical protein
MPRIQMIELPKEMRNDERTDRIIEESSKRDVWVSRLILIFRIIVATLAFVLTIAYVVTK